MNQYRPVESKLLPGWYEIPGYPNNLASKKGEIMNIQTGRYTLGGNAGRYLKVKVYRGEDEFATMQYVHELVCRAFNGPRPGTSIVSHKDSNKKNNTWTNLEWDSQSNNVKISYVERRNRVAMESRGFGQWSNYLNIALEFLDDKIQRINVTSSNLNSVAYDENEEIMEVEFKNGSVYQYFDVPKDVYLDLFDAMSAGRYLNDTVKGKYRYTKV